MNRNIIILTRFEAIYDEYKNIDGTAHLFTQVEPVELKSNHPLKTFIENKLSPINKEDIINNLDKFKDWWQNNIKEDDTNTKRKKKQVNTQLSKQQVSEAYQGIIEFLEKPEYETSFKKEFNEEINKQQEKNKSELTEYKAKFPDIFKYKEIPSNLIKQKISDWDEGAIILLPCYQRFEKLKYTYEKDRTNLIAAICNTFIPDKFAKGEIENYLYIHDKEWGGTICDYCVKESDFKEEDATLKAIIKDYFDNNVRIFNHSKDSLYFIQLLYQIENLLSVEYFEKRRDILIDSLKTNPDIQDGDIKSKLSELKENLSFENLFKIEDALIPRT